MYGRSRRFPLTRRLSRLVACLLLVASAPFSIASAQALPDEPVLFHDFESDTHGWGSRGEDEAVALAAEAAHGGESGLRTSSRAQGWQGPVLDLTASVVSGERYAFSVWLKLAEGERPADLRVSLQTVREGTPGFAWLDGNRTVGPNGWVKFGGEFEVPPGLESIAIYVESDTSLADVLLDEV